MSVTKRSSLKKIGIESAFQFDVYKILIYKAAEIFFTFKIMDLLDNIINDMNKNKRPGLSSADKMIQSKCECS
jgi:hypothetical protein